MRRSWITTVVMLVMLQADPASAQTAECPWKLKRSVSVLDEARERAGRAMDHAVESSAAIAALRQRAMTAASSLDGCGERLRADLEALEPALKGYEPDAELSLMNDLVSCGRHFTGRLKSAIAAAEASGDALRVQRLTRLRNRVTRFEQKAADHAQLTQSLVFKTGRLATERDRLSALCSSDLDL